MLVQHSFFGRLFASYSFLALIWIVHRLDVVSSLYNPGVKPGQLSIVDILLSPILHAPTWMMGDLHVLSNTFILVPMLFFLALLSTMPLIIIAMIGILEGLFISMVAAPNIHPEHGLTQGHIGASGVALGLIGFNIVSAIKSDKKIWAVIGGALLVLYGFNVLISFAPIPGVSWQGHLGGFLAGVALALIGIGRKG